MQGKKDIMRDDKSCEDQEKCGEGHDDVENCWRWISVNLEYLLYIGFDYDLQLTRH
jgi:hypothetical protein